MITKSLKAGLVVIAIVGLGLTALVGYRLIFLTIVRVPTGSMANTIIPGDYLVVRKRAFGEIKRGDLIIFQYPRDISTSYVSRVVALPEEVVEVRGKLVYINGTELMERRVTVEPDLRLTGLLHEISTKEMASTLFFTVRRKGTTYQMSGILSLALARRFACPPTIITLWETIAIIAATAVSGVRCRPT